MRVCVIGAGAGGICAARRVQEDGQKNGIDNLEIRIFEQSSQLGGTWVLEEEEEGGGHSSMYTNLRTNIPRELMEFDDFPFLPTSPTESSFPEQPKVLKYLDEFAEPIKHLIQFNTRVLSLRKNVANRWAVTFQPSSISTTTTTTELFDVVFVCNGHYSSPRIPEFAKKLHKLPWLHSHRYRRAEDFAGKTVAIVGAGLSGSDIVMQLEGHAKKIHFLHMAVGTMPINGTNDGSKMNSMCGSGLMAPPFFFKPTERPTNCEEGFRIVDANDSSLILADGTELGGTLDAVIFCTGYRYSMPFLEAEGLVNCPEDGAFVSPLWAKFVHIHHPRSLFILGLPFPTIPFPQFDCQMRLALALIHGRVQPPSLEEMLAEEEKRLSELKRQGMPAKNFHKFSSLNPWEYYDWLDGISGNGQRRPPVMLGINKHFRHAKSTTRHYRDVRYLIKNEEEFEVVNVGRTAQN